VVVPVVDVDAVELDVAEEPEPLEAVDELELEDVEELDEPLLAVDELLEPVVAFLVVDDEPAFLVVFFLEVEPLVAVPAVPVVPDAAPSALEPPEAELPAPPVVLPVVPRPVPVVAPAPPTSPIKASTWQRTVALSALSIVPLSTTTISTSPESIATNRKGACAFPK